MFNKNKFAQIIKNIKETYNSQEEFSEKSDIGRTYLSQYMNMKLDDPPKPKILEKLANSSNGIATYKELMDICGYTEKNIETKVLAIYKNLKEFHKYINNGKSDDDNFYQIEGFIEDFQTYLYKLYENITFKYTKSIFLSDIFDFSTAIEDYIYISGFLSLYNEFLKLLENENYIDINNYNFIDCFDIEDIYNNLSSIEHLELFSLYSKNITLHNNKNELDDLVKYINSFSRCLSFAHLSEFDSNSLIDIFKKKIDNQNIKDKKQNSLYLIPILGRITAGQPILADEHTEGYIPTAPEAYNLTDVDVYFYLRVSGNSMNKVVKDGSYVLIEKQDYADDGDIIVAIVNGDQEATLKKYKKINDSLIVLEPQSDESSFEPIYIDKDTNFQIIGKAIGYFGKF